MSNALPEHGASQSPNNLATGKQENFSNIQTFGCRIWVCPPGYHTAKLKPNSHKGVFLWYIPHTTCNIPWYDTKIAKVKIPTHACFEEGMNNLPVTEMPKKVAHLVCMDDGQHVTPDVAELHASNFAFDIVPFVLIFTGWLKCSNSLNNNSFRLLFEDNPILHCTFVSKIAKRSGSSALCSLYKAICCKLLGTYVLRNQS